MNATNKYQSKETIIVLIAACLVMNYFFKNQNWIFAALILGLIGIFSDYVSDKIHFLWMSLANILSKISTSILLFLLFFIILTPLAFLRKKFKPFNFLLKNNHLNTTFKEINKTFSKSDLEKMW